MFALLIAQIIAFSAPPLYFTYLSGLVRRAHFYVYLSLLLLVGGFLGNVYSIALPGGITVSGGNLCYGAFMMTAVMFVWMEKDAFILRHVVRLVVLVDIFNVTFSYLTQSILRSPGVSNQHAVPPALFEISSMLIILGGVLIVLELLLLLFIFEQSKKRQIPILFTALVYLLSFILVLLLDGVAFPFIAFGMSAPIVAAVFGGLSGKLFIATAFSLPLALFMIWRRKEFTSYLDSDTIRWRLLASSSADLIREMARKDEDVHRGDIIFRNSAEGLAFVDHSGTVLKSNAAFRRMIAGEGTANHDLASSVQDIFYDEHGPVALPILTRDEWRKEIFFGPQKHSGVLSITPVGNHANEVGTCVYSLTDISEQKNAQKNLEYIASHDFLTGLPNRRMLDRVLSAPGAERPNGLMIVDVDRFKEVNDSRGHTTGDLVLQEIARALQRVASQKLAVDDAVCRIGGDEFAIILQHFDRARVEDIAAEIGTAMERTIRIGDSLEFLASVTIGVSGYSDASGHDLLLEADAALYEAKRSRKGSVGFYEERLTSESQRNQLVAVRLKNALANGELAVHYQPQFDALSHQLRGVEALARWTDPVLGAVSPAIFIPVAEATGLIEALGEYVMERACRDGQEWIKQGLLPVSVSVNVSASQLRSGRFMTSLKQILASTEFPPSRLEIEVTESSYIEREGEVTPILKALMDMGISIAIDDFGTGYSSLSYLRDMPWSCIKIDKSFIVGIPDDAKQCNLTTAIIRLAKSMSFKVVAEGVETQRQLTFLTAQGCDLIQGYHFSPAVPKAELVAILGSQTGSTGQRAD